MHNNNNLIAVCKAGGELVMKFNERELAAWATVFAPDKEGILEKKGAGIGQGI